jgi:hypothetical protein
MRSVIRYRLLVITILQRWDCLLSIWKVTETDRPNLLIGGQFEASRMCA